MLEHDKLIDILENILELQGHSTESISNESVIIGKGAVIDSLSLALLLVEIEKTYNYLDLFNKIASTDSESLSLIGLEQLISREYLCKA